MPAARGSLVFPAPGVQNQLDFRVSGHDAVPFTRGRPLQRGAKKKIGFDSCGNPGLDIGFTIAQQYRPLEIDIELPSRLQDHPRSRFTERGIHLVWTDTVFRMEGAKIDFVDDDLLISENAAHPFTQCAEIILGVVAAADAGLIGDDKNPVTETNCVTAEVEDSINKLKILATVHIIMINVDDSVTIEEECRLRFQVDFRSKNS